MKNLKHKTINTLKNIVSEFNDAAFECYELSLDMTNTAYKKALTSFKKN